MLGSRVRVPIALCMVWWLHAVTQAAAGGTTTLYDAQQPPWVRGSAPPASARVVAVPVGVAPAPFGTPEGWVPTTALQRLAEDLTSRLSSRPGVRVVPLEVPGEGAPSVRLGCVGEETGEDVGEDCNLEARGLRLAVTQSTKTWRGGFLARLEPLQADHLLLLRVAVRDHWLMQKGLSGKKEVPLGSGHAQPAPWLTSLDTPVAVLQLEGVLVGPEGKVVRSAVEGIYATRTRFGESVAGLQRVMTDEDVARIRTELRREDLPGAPLVWEAALDALVRGLLGR